MLTDMHIRLPWWTQSFLAAAPRVYPTAEDRMSLAIGLSSENVKHRTGGPFGAAVFDADGRLIACGVNMVVAANCSVLHAEIAAIMLAQKSVGRYDLSDGGILTYSLAAATEPCAMCFGALPWSGIRELVCGARDEDARAIGFDEGPKMAEWVDALTSRGITVVRDVLRNEAASVLRTYAAAGGPIYNAGAHTQTPGAG